ncbi:tRNA/rRNA methyltransferase [Enterobacteriaceae bacterium]
MNDDLKGKSGKVRVMYVRGDDNADKRSENPRTGKGGSRAKGSSRAEGGRRGPRDENRSRDAGRGQREEGSSPWRTVSRPPREDVAQDAGTDAPLPKGYVDPEVIRKQRAEEARVYGENACQALFMSRPDAIVRAWFVQSVTPRFKEALRWMAANRKAYHVVEDADLVKASGTEHHGGVCFIIKKRSGISVSQWLSKASDTDCVLALEDVGNPHNLGAIVRSCAHFGVKGVVVQDTGLLESGAAIRTAEGGAEHVEAITGDSFQASLDAFRDAGYAIVTTSSHKGTPLFSATLPKKMVLVLGQEKEGVSDATFAGADLNIAIDGTGKVESLNVSVATGILLAEWWRQRHS